MTLPEKNGLEWTVFALALVLVTTIVGWLAWDTATYRDTPPDLTVTLGPGEKMGSEYRVPIKVENRGGKTAENLLVEVALERPRTDPEIAQVQFQFAPRKGKSAGWAVFATDPGTAVLRARILGFEEP